MKKLITLIIAAVMTGMLLCTGCGSMERVDYQAVLLDYLSNRYPDDTFTVSSNQLDTGENTPELFFLHFRSEKYPDEGIIAWAEKVDGKYNYEDNYMKYYLRKDIESYVHDIAEKHFGECKVFVRFSNYFQSLPESFPTDATAEDYLKTGQDCYFLVYVSPGHISLQDAREELKNYKSELEKCEFENIGSAVYIVNDAESFKNTNSYAGPTGNAHNKSHCDWVGSLESVQINE